MIFVAACWSFVGLRLSHGLYPESLEFRVIGWIIPGLIANNFERQGIINTIASLIVVTVAAYFLGRLFHLPF